MSFPLSDATARAVSQDDPYDWRKLAYAQYLHRNSATFVKTIFTQHQLPNVEKEREKFKGTNNEKLGVKFWIDQVQSMSW